MISSKRKTSHRSINNQNPADTHLHIHLHRFRDETTAKAGIELDINKVKRLVAAADLILNDIKSRA